jgi:hypothetical protein
MKGICGYGRYDDDPNHVGCPYTGHAKHPDMVPCIARDGSLALADATKESPVRVCVYCGHPPRELLQELADAGVADIVAPESEAQQADLLHDIVRRVTEPASSTGRTKAP